MLQSSDSLNLDIHDPATSELDCLAERSEICRTLVETDRRAHHCLKCRMSLQVPLRQRLLDHHHLEIIKRFEMINIVSGVGTICVRHQFEPSKFPPHGKERFNIPPRLNLDLHSLVTFDEVPLNRCEERAHRGIDSDGKTGFNVDALTSQKFMERKPPLLRFEIPEGGLDTWNSRERRRKWHWRVRWNPGRSSESGG